MLMNWLFSWMGLPGWFLEMTTGFGYLAIVVFLVSFVATSLFSLSESSWEDKKKGAVLAVWFLGYLCSALLAGAMGPITVFLIDLVRRMTSIAFYNPVTRKWNWEQ